MNTLPLVLAVIYVANFLIGFTVIFLERKNPSATLAWLMVLFILPGIGVILYIMLSQNFSKHKLFKLTTFEQRRISEALGAQMDDMRDGHFVYTNISAAKWGHLIHLNQKYGSAYLTQDNSIEVLTNGAQKFEELIKDIAAAKRSINIEYYILKPDGLGLKLLRALTERARAGVEVRLLMDAMGSRKISDKHLKDLKAAGGKVALFFPPKFIRFNFKFNYRNHRKLVVIDGKIGYVGGFNVGNEYVGLSKKFCGWRDTHLRVEGGSVEDIDARFILDWRLASGEDYVLSSTVYGTAEEMGSSGVQIVSCGPDSPESEIKLAYLKMITSAERSIFLQTPYFIPDDSIFEGLKMAALAGIDVRVMIPNQPDHPFVYWVTYSNVGALLESGVKVYIYDNGFLHAKTITVDGEVSSVGSANFDIRSFKLNFESNAIIYDPHVAKKLEMAFENDMMNSFRLTSTIYRNRSNWVKFRESIGRLISDIL